MYQSQINFELYHVVLPTSRVTRVSEEYRVAFLRSDEGCLYLITLNRSKVTLTKFLLVEGQNEGSILTVTYSGLDY